MVLCPVSHTLDRSAERVQFASVHQSRDVETEDSHEDDQQMVCPGHANLDMRKAESSLRSRS